MKTLFKSIAYLLFVAGLGSHSYAAVFYVKAGAVPGRNGSSWAKAFNNLDAALAAAVLTSESDQIWVAKGTYKPTVQYGGTYGGTEPNLVTFKLPNNVSIYGGFIGNETQLSLRNREANPTILSGDLSGNDINTPGNTLANKADNAWHVLTAEGVTGVTLDSLIVQGGFAAGPDLGELSTDLGFKQFNLVSLDYTHATGGGLLARHGAKITLNNMRLDYNGVNADPEKVTVLGPNFAPPGQPPVRPALASGGGAIAAVDEDTLVTIQNSVFSYNTAYNFGANGGALNALLEASFDISGSKFQNNVANRIGGAIRAKNAKLINVSTSVFNNNIITLLRNKFIGDESGGAIGTTNTSLSVSGCSFDSNVSGPIAGAGAILFHTPFDDGEPYTLTVDTSKFTNNRGASFGGGAINIFGAKQNPGSQATISNSSFNNNIAAVGGAVYIDSIPTVITNSSFIENQAWINGGAVFASNFGDAIFGVTILEARSLTNVSGSSFKSNSIVGVPSGAFPPAMLFDIVASFQAATNGFPEAHVGFPPGDVNGFTPGGGAIAVEFGGKMAISSSSFKYNTAPNAKGGAILVGGSLGCANGSCEEGATQLVMDQAFVDLKTSSCSQNSDASGSNNVIVWNPANIGNDSAGNPGVQLVSDGSCPEPTP